MAFPCSWMSNKKYAVFTARKMSTPSQKELTGDWLVEKHHWKRFDNVRVSCKSLPGVHVLRDGYIGYARKDLANRFAVEGFPLLEAGIVYAREPDGSLKPTEAGLTAPDETEAMEAQKVLGEGVFAMVRRSLYLKGLI